MITTRPVFYPLLLLLALCQPAILLAKERSIAVSADEELSVTVYPADGQTLLLWIAPEYGIRDAHRALAQQLSQQGIEVWQTDILESLFLPYGSTSMKKISGTIIASLIQAAHRQSKKRILLAGDSWAALPVLRGAHAWQQQQHSPYLTGAILFSPSTYVAVPKLGQLPRYMPVVAATNIPLLIFQTGKHANIGQFPRLLQQLQQHGNPVYSKILPGMVGIFYQEKYDPQILQALAHNIARMIPLLEKYPVPNRPPAIAQVKIPIHKGLDNKLEKYHGKVQPLPIALPDSQGKRYIRTAYKGQVTVINFWATWCPPCVEEIPSLNRLKQKMEGYRFELISINYAEDTQTIRDFMKKVNVEFPVLLDKQGDFARQWNIVAYPSTFVIGPQGSIVYGVNAAIEWDHPDVLEKMKQLLKSEAAAGNQ